MTTPAALETQDRATYRALFRVGQFRVLMAGLTLFGIGFEIEVLAMSVLVYARTSSPLLAAVTFGVGFLPQLAGGALLSSLADRLPPRRAIVLGLLARAAPGLVIGLAPALPVWGMLAIVAAAAVFAPLVTGSTSGLLPDLFSGDHYVLARSLFGFTMSATQLAGLAVGGAVLAAVSAQHLLLLAGASLALAAVVTRAGLTAYPARGGSTAAAKTTRSRLSEVADVLRSTLRGNAILLRDRRIRRILLAFWVPSSLITGAESLIVPYTGVLGASASTSTVLLAALPIGMLVSNLVLGRFASERHRARLVLPLALLAGAPLIGFAATPQVAVSVVLLGLAGVGAGYMLGLQQPFLDAVPVDRRGQAFALNGTGMMGGQGLTPPLVGLVATAAGTGVAMATAGAVSALAAIVLLRGGPPVA